MMKFLLHKSLAVYLIFLIAVVWGGFCFFNIPVSLLPNIEKPAIQIKINYPNHAAQSVESNVTKIIREGISSVGSIKSIESESYSHFALVNLSYEFGTNMSDEFIKLNERIDQLLPDLPSDFIRPQLIKQNVSDVPIVNLQITPQVGIDLLEASDITLQLIKRRIEKIEGVSLVDINGLKTRSVRIILDKTKIRYLGLEEQKIRETVQTSGSSSGALTVKDGNYSYLVKMANNISDIDHLKDISIRLENNRVISLRDIAKIESVADQEVGKHLFNNDEAIVLAIHKQANARMNEVIQSVHDELDLIRKDYNKLNFDLTQDQTYLLNAGIENLTQDLIYGGILCVLLLFLFVNNISSPVLMGISIPISLLLTFICFYYFKISFNIISLSGLALGIGMLIDNSIVVIDSISRNYLDFDLEEACIKGAGEVFVPVLSQVLSTIVIYAPLIYLSGIAGELIYDQAIALTISLFVSLFVAFILTPVLFYSFNARSKKRIKSGQETFVFKFIMRFYDVLFEVIFRNRRKFVLGILILIPLGYLIAVRIPIRIMPQFEENETSVNIDWNEPVGIQENENRINELSKLLHGVVHWEADIGISDFMIDIKRRNINSSDIYYKCTDTKSKNVLDKKLSTYFNENYPNAFIKISGAKNAFTHLFENDEPQMEIRFRQDAFLDSGDSENNVQLVKNALPELKWENSSNLSKVTNVDLHLNERKLSSYQLEKSDVIHQLKSIFNDSEKIKFTGNGDVFTSQIVDTASLIQKFKISYLKNSNDGYFQLQNFVSYDYSDEDQSISADKFGYYKSIFINEKPKGFNIDKIQKQLNELIESKNLNASLTGAFKAEKEIKKDLFIVVILSLILLFALLAIQFDNFLHPFVVMSSLPCALFGSFFTLWIMGGEFDIMAGIGIIVVLGIIVDDPTLKVETVNRLIKEAKTQGRNIDRENLISLLHDAGRICLKPLIMVSLTTTLALVPVYFSHGIGNDIQRNFVSVVVGGLSLGTILSFCFIPLVYYAVTKKNL
ncbi:efflux RND transporter permease subunit [Sphingobacterium detergens]|nr:efflux RND transporter permease subunit [Sphingobacterium detergens]